MKISIASDVNEIPTDHLIFEDIIDSFHSPRIWVYTDDTPSAGPFVLNLEGDSTVLFYNAKSTDVKWTPYSEPGVYVVEFEEVGEGAVYFPHIVEFQIDVQVFTKKLSLLLLCDGANTNALHLTLRNQTPATFFDTLHTRLADTLTTTILAAFESFDFKEGQAITFPAAQIETLEFKLGLLGLKLESVEVDQISEADAMEEEITTEKETSIDIDTEVSAVSSDKINDEIPASSTVAIPRPGDAPLPSPPSAPVASTPPAIPKPSVPSTPPPSTPVTSTPPTISKPSVPSTPPPSVPLASTPPPSAIPKVSKDVVSGVTASPPDYSVSSQTVAKETVASPHLPTAKMDKEKVSADEVLTPSTTKKKSVRHPHRRTSRKRTISSKATVSDLDDLFPEEPTINLEVESLEAIKFAKVEWFNRMIVNRVYPLTVRISTQELKASKKQVAILSGEEKSEVAQEITLDLETPVIVRPEFPGCIVTPPERIIEATTEDASLSFFVTPLAKGEMQNRVVFQQGTKIQASILLEGKVIDHRLAKLLAYGGSIAGSVPTIFAFVVGQTLGDFFASRLGAALGNVALISQLLVTIGLLGGGGYVFYKNNQITTTTTNSQISV